MIKTRAAILGGALCLSFGADAQDLPPGTRVDAMLGGTAWQSCTIVKHNIKQGDYEVKCDGKPDTARVEEGPDHIRTATAATQAAATATVAQQKSLWAPRQDINANLRPVTLGRSGMPLSGVYLQLKPMMGNAASGIMSFDYFTFWPDGRVCEDLPAGGADPADYDAVRRAKPRLCGRYVFTPAKLTIDVPDNVKTFDHPVSNFDGTNFVMGGYPTVKVAAYPAGARLSGTFQGMQFAPYIHQTWSFRPDGSFTLQETGERARTIQGRYNLHGNTLDLGSERHTIFPQTAAKAGRLVIDGHDMDPA